MRRRPDPRRMAHKVKNKCGPRLQRRYSGLSWPDVLSMAAQKLSSDKVPVNRFRPDVPSDIPIRAPLRVGSALPVRWARRRRGRCSIICQFLQWVPPAERGSR